MKVLVSGESVNPTRMDLQAGIRPVVTALSNLEKASLQAASGTIVDQTERLH
jgi:hypothetical protein